MSIFADLGIPTTVVSFSLIEQTAPGADPTEFRTSKEELLARMRAESAALKEAFAASLAEVRVKTAQVAMGSLNQYLSTPIKSDNEDVQRIIKDAFEKYTEQILPSASVGLETSWYSAFIGDGPLLNSSSRVPVLVRNLLSGGKRELQRLGFKQGKTSGSLFETVHLVRTGMNLDALEYLIARSFSGEEQRRVVSHSRGLLSTLLSSNGDSEQIKSLWEATIVPAIDGSVNPEFISGFEAVSQQLMKEFNVHHVSLWRNKMLLTEDKPFVVRIRVIPDQKLLFEIVKWLSTAGSELSRKQLTEKSALLVKEIIS